MLTKYIPIWQDETDAIGAGEIQVDKDHREQFSTRELDGLDESWNYEMCVVYDTAEEAIKAAKVIVRDGVKAFRAYFHETSRAFADAGLIEGDL